MTRRILFKLFGMQQAFPVSTTTEVWGKHITQFPLYITGNCTALMLYRNGLRQLKDVDYTATVDSLQRRTTVRMLQSTDPSDIFIVDYIVVN